VKLGFGGSPDTIYGGGRSGTKRRSFFLTMAMMRFMAHVLDASCHLPLFHVHAIFALACACPTGNGRLRCSSRCDAWPTQCGASKRPKFGPLER
jgi:hypothetical protein